MSFLHQRPQHAVADTEVLVVEGHCIQLACLLLVGYGDLPPLHLSKRRRFQPSSHGGVTKYATDGNTPDFCCFEEKATA